ncbi:Piso0_005717 [Millerozyma farinosa CBS 7064]|uniref:Piso0_005717 protein n=1 Tax=Pichia sorbitophila (strain ATCC MYA-4447 / BCRC 22081 / CBS 7064 / NBRC 10061 / NRRL Y-12695) TaxID=559304 RepID=G8Y2Q7_PICSO|nr:Piso0_005717 [Millerozyma farinosa CBS 7064]
MERIFYKTDVVDPDTKLPVYIFDTSYLPSTKVINYDRFIPTLMETLPSEKYVLIMLSCGLNKISWIWGIKFLKTFLGDNESNLLDKLVRIITVHDSWFVKTITEIFKNYSITRKNFSLLNKLMESFNLISDFEMGESNFNTIRHYANLAELHRCIDITKLKISLNVYKYDCQLGNDLDLLDKKPILNQNTQIDPVSEPSFYHHFYQIFNIIDSYGDKSELIFHRPGNKLSTDILFKCLIRNSVFWINDWDIFCIATTFKKILMELPYPFISIDLIELPVKDDINYTKRNLDNILFSYQGKTNYRQVLLQICDLCQNLMNNRAVTKHTSSTLAKCLSHCLSQELVSLQNKDNILVISRFIKNLFDYWHQIRGSYSRSYQTIKEIVEGDSPDEVSHSYEVSYDVTIEEDENERVVANTSNILSMNRDLINESDERGSVASDESLNKTLVSREASRESFFDQIEQKDDFFPSYDEKHSSSSTDRSTLSDVTNIGIQYPPQKYKFQAKPAVTPSRTESVQPPTGKKPVIRGRKVGELAQLFEERAQGIDLLKSM